MMNLLIHITINHISTTLRGTNAEEKNAELKNANLPQICILHFRIFQDHQIDSNFLYYTTMSGAIILFLLRTPQFSRRFLRTQYNFS